LLVGGLTSIWFPLSSSAHPARDQSALVASWRNSHGSLFVMQRHRHLQNLQRHRPGNGCCAGWCKSTPEDDYETVHELQGDRQVSGVRWHRGYRRVGTRSDLDAQGGLDFNLAHYRRPCELADDEHLPARGRWARDLKLAICSSRTFRRYETTMQMSWTDCGLGNPDGNSTTAADMQLLQGAIVQDPSIGRSRA
jgi:hypothetical protein